VSRTKAKLLKCKCHCLFCHKYVSIELCERIPQYLKLLHARDFVSLSLSRLSIIFVSRALLRIAADFCIYVFVFSAAPILKNKRRLFAI